jgi:uncharacterized protein (TIGR02996 family)
MMTIEELYQAVCEHPEDDDARLEYAGLIESSDPDHARLIRIQIKYASERRSGSRFYGSEMDEDWLIRQNRARWARDIAKFAPHGSTHTIEFDRGFPAKIDMQPGVFAEYADLIFRLAPIRHIDFVSPLNEDGELICDKAGNKAPFPMDIVLACPQLSRLDSIGFSNVELKIGHRNYPGDGAKIARCPHLTRCVHMNFAFTVIGMHDFHELAEGELTRKMLVVTPLDVGEQRVNEFDDRGREYTGTVFSEEWRAIERRLGYIPWLHPSHNGKNRYDARWFFEQGKLPKYPPGSPPKDEWYDVPRIYERPTW